MTTYLWVKQDEVGCGYTIGCGQNLVEIIGSTQEELKEAVVDALEGIGVGDDWEERRLQDARLLTFNQDVMPWVEEYMVRRREEKAELERKKKRAEIARLQKELGE